VCGRSRRFRFKGKKEAAGVAVAVIQVGIMGIEFHSVIRGMLFGDAIVQRYILR
jgi:hypothetical protein